MKAAVVEAPGRPRVDTVADPEAGDEDVVVAVKACGICATDLHIVDGEFLARYPIVPGHEFRSEELV